MKKYLSIILLIIVFIVPVFPVFAQSDSSTNISYICNDQKIETYAASIFNKLVGEEWFSKYYSLNNINRTSISDVDINVNFGGPSYIANWNIGAVSANGSIVWNKLKDSSLVTSNSSFVNVTYTFSGPGNLNQSIMMQFLLLSDTDNSCQNLLMRYIGTFVPPYDISHFISKQQAQNIVTQAGYDIVLSDLSFGSASSTDNSIYVPVYSGETKSYLIVNVNASTSRLILTQSLPLAIVGSPCIGCTGQSSWISSIFSFFVNLFRKIF